MVPVRYRSIASDSARWDGFPFREGDIVISTPPKCGTTWTQMICALLVFGTPKLDRPLVQISQWRGVLDDEVLGRYEARLAELAPAADLVDRLHRP